MLISLVMIRLAFDDGKGPVKLLKQKTDVPSDVRKS